MPIISREANLHACKHDHTYDATADLWQHTHVGDNYRILQNAAMDPDPIN